MRTAYKNIGLGLFLLALSLFVLFWLIPVGVDSPGSIKRAVLAPAFWPRIIMIVMTGLSAIITVQGFNRLRLLRTMDAEVEEPPVLDRTGIIKTLAAAIALFVFTWAMSWGGIVVPSMAALAFFMMLFGERRLTVLVPVSVGVPLALYYFFLKVALVPMPLGIFENLFS